jgi:hypothetical protein
VAEMEQRGTKPKTRALSEFVSRQRQNLGHVEGIPGRNALRLFMDCGRAFAYQGATNTLSWLSATVTAQ